MTSPTAPRVSSNDAGRSTGRVPDQAATIWSSVAEAMGDSNPAWHPGYAPTGFNDHHAECGNAPTFRVAVATVQAPLIPALRKLRDLGASMNRPSELAATDQTVWDDTSPLPFEVGAVSWSAIFAGAAAAAALSLILLILGADLGLSAISLWAQDRISAKDLGVSTVLWLSVTQLLTSGMGCQPVPSRSQRPTFVPILRRFRCRR